MVNVANELVKAPEPERDRYGRPRLVIDGDVKTFTRVTTLASTLSDRFGLEQWACRMTAIGVAQRPDLLKAVAATPPDDTKALNLLVTQAKEAAGSSTAATTGTALHQITEQIDTGRITEPPEIFAQHVNLYRQALTAGGIEILPEHVERFVVNTTLGVAGTADRIVSYNNKYVVADLKTGKHLNWDEISIQLACYAYADLWYDTRNKQAFDPLIEVDRTVGIVIHLPAAKEQCNLYFLDLEQGIESAKLAHKVRGWRNSTKPLEQQVRPKKPSITEIVEKQPAAIPDQTSQLRTWLLNRFGFLQQNYPQTLQHLAAIWPIGIPTFKQSETHTIQQLESIYVASQQAERKTGAPFPEDIAPTRVNVALNHAVDFDLTMVPAIIFSATHDREGGPSTSVDSLSESEIELLQQICQQIHEGTLQMVASTSAPGGWKLREKNADQPTIQTLLF